jgi:hypothetical protein
MLRTGVCGSARFVMGLSSVGDTADSSSLLKPTIDFRRFLPALMLLLLQHCQ